jgi:hypothetical protein
MPMSPRTLRPGGVFTPRSIRGLQLWLDGADSSSSSMTLNGSNVSVWIDKSGKGNSATQSTANNQPALTSNALNGKSVVTFGASPIEMLTSLTLNPPFTVVCVVKENSAHVGAYFAGTTFQNLGFGDASSFGGNKWASWGGVRAIYGNASASVTTSPTIVSSVVAGTSFPSDISTFANGVGGVVSVQTSGTAPGSTIDSVRIGHRGGTTGEYWNGYIAEVIAYSVQLSQPQRAALEKWLGRKWGITVA